MPEIKEIRKFADFIREKIKNKQIVHIEILNGRYKTHGPFDNYDILKDKLPLKVIDVKTKGKLLYIVFEEELYMFNALGLNGGWCYLKEGTKDHEFSKNLEDYSRFLPEKKIQSYVKNALNHLNVEFKTKHGSLYFFDVMSFGSIKVVEGENELNKKLKQVGPDIMDEETDYELFKQQIKKGKNSDKEIGLVLMDQKVISGIGNYLRSDILYISKIDPFRKVKTLHENETKEIFNNSKILTWGDYDIKEAKRLKIINKNTKLPSDYSRTFYVYDEREDIHGNQVIKKELYEGTQKRFIYYVPEIQK